VAIGCNSQPAMPPAPPPVAVADDPWAGYGPPQFLDDVETNRPAASGALDLKFVDTAGQTVDLADYRGQKNLVLVFTRGFSAGRVCPICTVQTSRLISNYQAFAERDAEVLVVYPGDKQHVDELVGKARQWSESPAKEVPFPVLLDEDFKAVDQLGIRGDLAAPSTYLLDKQGAVRFAYVGANANDRPSIAAILKQLDALMPQAKSEIRSSKSETNLKYE
jgi:peroxiredoxin